MTQIDATAAELLGLERLRDDLKLDGLQESRKEYEERRDFWQRKMDTTDKLIHEIQKKKITT